MGIYEGPIDLESLKKFCFENIPLRCSLEDVKWCSEKQLVQISNLREMSEAERDSKIKVMETVEERSRVKKLFHITEKIRDTKKLETTAEETIEEAEEEGDEAKIKTAEEKLEVVEESLQQIEDVYDYAYDRLELEEPLELFWMKEIKGEIDQAKHDKWLEGVTFSMSK